MSSPQNVEGSGRGELELSLRTRRYIDYNHVGLLVDPLWDIRFKYNMSNNNKKCQPSGAKPQIMVKNTRYEKDDPPIAVRHIMPTSVPVYDRWLAPKYNNYYGLGRLSSIYIAMWLPHGDTPMILHSGRSPMVIFYPLPNTIAHRAPGILRELWYLVGGRHLPRQRARGLLGLIGLFGCASYEACAGWCAAVSSTSQESAVSSRVGAARTRCSLPQS